ncbi:hypothetical protein, partial [Paraburkholderia sp. UCT31]|uniref:hypothetical protein n=1 Tax=Paraburkholderia sp. UCT31 TaxID=2615209 RepID=UPI001CA3EB2C
VNQNRASINKRLPASINIGIIFLPRHSQADCRASLIQIVAPQIVANGNAQPAPMDLDGQPAGVTIVGRTNSAVEADASEQRILSRPWVRTPFTVLTYAFERALGKAATSLNGPHAPPAGTLRVVVAPR